MILVLSTSSPVVSVAVFAEDGAMVTSARTMADHNASGGVSLLVARILSESRIEVSDLTHVSADIGPGSFIGTRVAVTMAKSMAYALNIQTSGITSFDLIDPNQDVFIPNKKGEWFLRQPNQPPSLVTQIPLKSLGYGAGPRPEVFPDANRWDRTAASPVTSPFDLVPAYLVEPSISQSKRPQV